MLYHNAECHYAECRDLFITTLNVFMLSVVKLNVVMLSVMAPLKVVLAKFSTLSRAVLHHRSTKCMGNMQPLLALKTRPRFRPINLKLSNAHFKKIIICYIEVIASLITLSTYLLQDKGIIFFYRREEQD